MINQRFTPYPTSLGKGEVEKFNPLLQHQPILLKNKIFFCIRGLNSRRPTLYIVLQLEHICSLLIIHRRIVEPNDIALFVCEQVERPRSSAKKIWGEAGVNLLSDAAVFVPEEPGDFRHRHPILGHPCGGRVPEDVRRNPRQAAAAARTQERLLDTLNLLAVPFDHPRPLCNLGGETVDTKSATGKLILTIFAGFAQFERETMLERQREGIAKAKAENRYLGRKPSARLERRRGREALQRGAHGD